MVFSSWRGRVVAVAAAAVVGVGAVIAGSVGQSPYSPTPTPTATPAVTDANLFIVSGGGSCTRRSTPVDYASSATGTDSRCGDGPTAYAAANAGDLVLIKSGTYGSWIFGAKTISGSPVNILTYPGESSTVTELDFHNTKLLNVGGQTPRGTDLIARNNTTNNTVTFVDFTQATDVYLVNMTIDGQYRVDDTTSWGGDSLRTGLKGVDACCTTDSKILASSIQGALGANLNTLIQDSVIHGTRRTSQAVHNECWLASGHTNTTIERSHFYGCNVMDINFGGFGGASTIPITGFVIRNNIFEAPTDTTELPSDKTNGAWFNGCDPTDISEGFPGAIIEYNVFETGWYIGGSGTDCIKSTGTVFRGNIGKAGGQCPTGATWVKNAWSDRSCGGTDQVISTLFTAGTNFTNITGHDWHPPSSSAAQCGQGDTSSYPATDKDSVTRVSPPDAGPYEC
jgi:hypothetical protein